MQAPDEDSRGEREEREERKLSDDCTTLTIDSVARD